MASLALLGQTVVNGILLGGIYAVAAIGLSLVFGIMDVVNVSHGHFLMLGGYVAVLLFAVLGLTPLVGMFVAIALLFVVGLLVERVLLRHVMERDIEQPLLFLFGLALVLQNLGGHFLGSSSRSAELGLPSISPQVGRDDSRFPFYVGPGRRRSVSSPQAAHERTYTVTPSSSTDSTDRPVSSPQAGQSSRISAPSVVFGAPTATSRVG